MLYKSWRSKTIQIPTMKCKSNLSPLKQIHLGFGASMGEKTKGKQLAPLIYGQQGLVWPRPR